MAPPLLVHIIDDDDAVLRCGIGLLGMGSTPERGTPAESAIVGRPVGDISAEDGFALAEKAFGGWAKPAAPVASQSWAEGSSGWVIPATLPVHS